MKHQTVNATLAIYSLGVVLTAIATVEAQSPSPSTSGNTIPVTADNFTRAETDRYARVLAVHLAFAYSQCEPVTADTQEAGQEPEGDRTDLRFLDRRHSICRIR